MKELWEADLEGMPVGAVLNKSLSNPHKQKKSRYFNAGLLVYDLKMWREENLSEKLLENFKENLWFDHDQGTLNAVFAERWKELDYSWNTCKGDDTSAGIIHYMARPKPWEGRENSELWFQIFEQTPFKDEVQKKKEPPKGIVQKIADKVYPWLREPWLKFKSYQKRISRSKES